MSRGALPGRSHEYPYPLGTDTGPEGRPSRPRRKPPTRPPADDPPRWDGALCEGRWGEFDLDLIRGDTAGLNAAIATCRSCPCLTECHDFARRTKATGVVQGGTAWGLNGPSSTGSVNGALSPSNRTNNTGPRQPT